ncbi:MAG: Maf family protein [Actinomycetota bacterium]|nr:Maf family protein [Actinomycetota bacterium]
MTEGSDSARADTMVLASASPRRRRLLGWLGLPFTATVVDTPEDLNTPLSSDPEALAISLAEEKARAARADGHGPNALVLCFDTIVVLDGALLGKPRDLPDAWRMLRALSGRVHQVVTGAALLCPGEAGACTFAVTTRVQMKPLTDSAIEVWMAQGEFMGCAGAYNIEGQIAEVGLDECYQNVAGLPLCHLFAALSGALEAGGVKCASPCMVGEPTSPVRVCDAALGQRCVLGPKVTAS